MRTWIPWLPVLALTSCLSTDWCRNVSCPSGKTCDAVSAQCFCDPEQCPNGYGCLSDACAELCDDELWPCNAGYTCREGQVNEYGHYGKCVPEVG